jgi:hypothetical protein
VVTAVSAIVLIRLLQFRLEVRERRHLAFGVLVDPPVVDQPDRHGVQVVQLLPSRPLGDDEACAFEHAEVLHHSETGHLELRLQLGQRAAVTLEEPVEQETPRRVCERLEHAIVVVHALHDR